MPRKPRLNVKNGIYHVYSRGNARGALFLDDHDHFAYLAVLTRVVNRMSWRLLAYCLMTNHVHLLIETPEANLSKGMQLLNGPYTQAFNKRHGRSGHLFQGRFGSVLVTNQSQLLAVVTYIANNPVDAGLCDRPAEWRWSSSYHGIGGSARPRLRLDRLRELGVDERRVWVSKGA